VASISIAALFSLAAMLSVSIGLINLVPIPMLDGGQVVAIDLDRPGLILWTAHTDSDLTGALAMAGERLVSCHEDGTLRLFDRSDGTARGVHHLGITPLGGAVVSGGTAMVIGTEGVALGLALD